MNKTKCTLSVLSAFLFVIACAAAGQAQAQRTFVAGPGIGLDTNNTAPQGFCSFTNPCRNFSVAYGVTNVGGEIIALSPGTGYGGLAITHAITVTGLPGQVAFVAVGTGSTGFTVNAGATEMVVVRDIHFNGAGFTTNTGLTHTSGKLVVKSCVFENLTTGVSVTNAKMDLINSDFFNNGTAVVSNGSGINTPGNPSVAPVALVRINGGNATNNTTGLLQQNPGTGPSATQLFNIAVFAPGSGAGGTMNLIGNTTNTTCSGTVNCNPNPVFYQMNSVF